MQLSSIINLFYVNTYATDGSIDGWISAYLIARAARLFAC